MRQEPPADRVLRYRTEESATLRQSVTSVAANSGSTGSAGPCAETAAAPTAASAANAKPQSHALLTTELYFTTPKYNRIAANGPFRSRQNSGPELRGVWTILRM